MIGVYRLLYQCLNSMAKYEHMNKRRGPKYSSNPSPAHHPPSLLHQYAPCTIVPFGRLISVASSTFLSTSNTCPTAFVGQRWGGLQRELFCSLPLFLFLRLAHLCAHDSPHSGPTRNRRYVSGDSQLTQSISTFLTRSEDSITNDGETHQYIPSKLPCSHQRPD
jgi:hypothetical protein